jgi:cytochrome P450
MSDANLSPVPFKFNLAAPELIHDPHPHYHRLRAQAPMYLTSFGAYLASRYDDCRMALRDRRFGLDFVQGVTKRYGPGAVDEPLFASIRYCLINLDPPDHTRLRSLFAKAFTTRTVEGMRPRIQAIVDATLDRVAPRGNMDLMRDFCFHLPVTVICEMLGIPEEDHAGFIERAGRIGSASDPTQLTRAELDAFNADLLTQEAYFHELFERRLREPGDDLTSQLLQAEEAGDKLTKAELMSNIMLLFGAGHVTTINLMGNGILALHRNPEQLALLKRDPALMPNAIEELLRYDPSVQIIVRTALEELELGGVLLARGQAVICLLGAANRDPAAYPDPDRLDITRPNVRPLSFGSGIHFCLGAQLARIEMEIALNSLFSRLPNLRLDEPEKPNWRNILGIRGLETLPASW